MESSGGRKRPTRLYHFNRSADVPPVMYDIHKDPSIPLRDGSPFVKIREIRG